MNNKYKEPVNKTAEISYKIVGQNIKTIRKSKNLTRDKFAKEVGLDIGTLNAIEQGIHFSFVSLAKICEYFSIYPPIMFFPWFEPSMISSSKINYEENEQIAYSNLRGIIYALIYYKDDLFNINMEEVAKLLEVLNKIIKILLENRYKEDK